MMEPVGMNRPALRFAAQVLEYELVQIRDLATILDISTDQIRKYIRCGQVKVTRIGVSIRITRSEALRFLATFDVHPEREPIQRTA